MIRFALLGALALSGCYEHHTAGDRPDRDGGTGTECGPGVCEEDEICCERCDGEPFCTFDRCPPDVCPSDCVTSFDCASDEYCSSDTGVCGTGMCEPIPDGCFGDCPLVCGCDGSTYCNVCEAARSRTSVLHFGECGTTVCACGPGTFCDFGPRCFDNPFPVCTPFPTECSGIFAPVCSCDGVTYPNSCLAAADGASVQFEGECEPERVRAVCEELCRFGRDVCGGVVDECEAICPSALSVCSDEELDRTSMCLTGMDCMSATFCLQEIPCIPITMM